MKYCLLRIENNCITIICDDLKQTCEHRIDSLPKEQLKKGD